MLMPERMWAFFSFREESLIDIDQALIRDGYRCVVIGKYDIGSVSIIQELEDTVIADPSLRVDATQYAYIFAESTNSADEPGSAKARPSFLLSFVPLNDNYSYI